MKYFLNLFTGGSVKEGFMDETEINTMFSVLEGRVSNLAVDQPLTQPSIANLSEGISTLKTNIQSAVFSGLDAAFESLSPTQQPTQEQIDGLNTAISAIKIKFQTVSTDAQRAADDAAATAEDYLDASRFHSKRLAQNSRYYEKRYEGYRNTAQIVLIATIIFVIISLISSYGIIPSSISTVLVPLMVGCFVFYLAYLYFDIAMRTQTDYDEYNFNRPGMDDRDNVGNE